MVQPERKPEEHYTYKDLRSWPEGERWELIDGVPYDMTPAPGVPHQRISRRLERQIDGYLAGSPCEMFHAPVDVFLPEGQEAEDEIDTLVQPDIFVVCDQAKVTDDGIKGAPDLVVEILSPSTAQKDLTLKFRVYERAGVREYWVVHPVDHTLMVFRLTENGQYGRPDSYGETDEVPVGVLDGLTIELQRVFAGEE